MFAFRGQMLGGAVDALRDLPLRIPLVEERVSVGELAGDDCKTNLVRKPLPRGVASHASPVSVASRYEKQRAPQRFAALGQPSLEGDGAEFRGLQRPRTPLVKLGLRPGSKQKDGCQDDGREFQGFQENKVVRAHFRMWSCHCIHNPDEWKDLRPVSRIGLGRHQSAPFLFRARLPRFPPVRCKVETQLYIENGFFLRRMLIIRHKRNQEG